MAEHYDWDRFLVPRQGGISPDSSEFMRDPEDPDARFWVSDDLGPKKLSDQAHLPVVVLLGEPGMGKTNVLKDARPLAEAEGRHAIWIDLDHTSSEDRLRDQLTGPQIVQAGSSAPPADLLIDGLDIGLLAIRTLAFLLAEVFRQYPSAADLRVRLTCRSAVWPSSLEAALLEHWGESGVGVFELAPLRARDAALAAEAEGLDADVFLERVRASHAGPLAARPVTLRFLLGLAKDGKPFPDTRVELYRQGCERLCSEENRTRRETGRHGNRSPSERLLIAARIAAVLTLADKGEWADTEWGLARHYGKLRHPGLADQLLPWIQDKGRFIVSRRIAIDIAEACELMELQDALVTLALDSTEQAPLRGQAVDALREIGDMAHRSRLLPLLDLSAEEDPEDEIAGDTMRALWPDAIELSALLGRIRPRRRPSLSGSYWGFVSIELPASLSPRDLPLALRWARERARSLDPLSDDFALIAVIISRAVQHMDAPGVAEELAETALPFVVDAGLPAK